MQVSKMESQCQLRAYSFCWKCLPRERIPIHTRGRMCHCRTARSIISWSNRLYSLIRRCFRWSAYQILVYVKRVAAALPQIEVRGIERWDKSCVFADRNCRAESHELGEQVRCPSETRGTLGQLHRRLAEHATDFDLQYWKLAFSTETLSIFYI